MFCEPTYKLSATCIVVDCRVVNLPVPGVTAPMFILFILPVAPDVNVIVPVEVSVIAGDSTANASDTIVKEGVVIVTSVTEVTVSPDKTPTLVKLLLRTEVPNAVELIATCPLIVNGLILPILVAMRLPVLSTVKLGLLKPAFDSNGL